MATKGKLDPSKIQIVDFHLIKGLIDSPFDFNLEKVEGHSFQVNFEMTFNLEDKLVKADFQVEIKTTSGGEQVEAQGSFHFVYIYEVGNLEELALKTKKKDQLDVSSDLGNALSSITYSTSRGILMTRFQGTALRNFVLPVVNPNDLLKK